MRELNEKERRRDRNRRYYEKNKEKIAKQHKRYREKNKEKLSKKEKVYYEKNKEKIAKQQKRYREKNKEKILKRQKMYYERRVYIPTFGGEGCRIIYTDGATEHIKKILPKLVDDVLQDCIDNPGKYLEDGKNDKKDAVN